MQVLRQIANDRDVVRHVVVRDPIAAFDSKRSSDWLAVLQDEFARGNRARCKAMTRRHGGLDSYFTSIGQSDFKPCEGFRFDYRHVVTWVDDDRIVAYRR